jgi:hypothetical protein
MSVRLSTLRICFGTAALAASLLLVGSAQAGSRQGGRPIEFTEPRSYEVTTNLQQLTSKRDGLKQLEEDLYKPLQRFTPKSSLEGVMAPPPRAPAPSAVQSKRAKELLERRKDWVFMTPEDLLSTPTVEQILKTPEYEPGGRAKKDLPAIERYYQRMIPKRPTRTNPAQRKDDDLFNFAKKSTSPEVAPPRNDTELPAGIKESAEALRNAFESGASDGPFGQGAASSSYSDPFRLASKAQSKEQALEHKKLMDEYRALVDPNWRPPVTGKPLSPALALAEPASSASKPAAGSPGVASPTLPKKADAQLDVLYPKLGPQALPDVNAQALGQTKSGSSLPKVQERRKMPLPPPDFTAPKRAF